jgi:hypothetical protein
MRLGFLLAALMWVFIFMVAFAAGASAAECPPWQANDICNPPRGELTWAWVLLAGGGFALAVATVLRGDR